MKLKILILPLILLVVFILFGSGKFVYLDKHDIEIVPSQNGNPTLILDGSMYYVRYWNLAPGCYKLTEIDLLGYRYATQVDDRRCPVQAKSN